MEPAFNFYDHTLAFSMETPKAGKEDISSDMMLEGNPTLITKGLIAKMEKNPPLADIIVQAAYNYLSNKEEINGSIKRLSRNTLTERCSKIQSDH